MSFCNCAHSRLLLSNTQYHIYRVTHHENFIICTFNFCLEISNIIWNLYLQKYISYYVKTLFISENQRGMVDSNYERSRIINFSWVTLSTFSYSLQKNLLFITVPGKSSIKSMPRNDIIVILKFKYLKLYVKLVFRYQQDDS